MTIVTRTAKGSELTYAELDGNFTDLDNRTKVAWQDMRGEIIVAGINNAPTPSTYKNAFQLFEFGPDTNQMVSVIIHVPKDYVVGTGVFPHVHVMTDIVGTGVVKLDFTYSYAIEYDAHDQLSGPPSGYQYFSDPVAFSITQEFSTPSKDAHYTIETPSEILMPGLQGDTMVLFTVERAATDVLDTYPNGLYLLYMDMYYRSQGFGSTYR